MERPDENEVYEVIIQNRRYFCVMVGDVEVSVRVPLDVFNAKNPERLEEYADALLHKVVIEKRKQSPTANRSLLNMTRLT